MARNPLRPPPKPRLRQDRFATQTNFDRRQAQEMVTFFREVAQEAMEEEVSRTFAEVRAESQSLPPIAELLTKRGRTPIRRAGKVELPKGTVAAALIFDHRPEIVKWIQDVIAQPGNVPVDSGEYSASFRVLINGQYALAGAVVPDADVAVVNITPYARRLEVGNDKDGKPFAKQAPGPHIVEKLVTRVIRRKWGKATNVLFNYADIPNPYILKQDHQDFDKLGRPKRRIRSGRRAGDPIRYPAIILRN